MEFGESVHLHMATKSMIVQPETNQALELMKLLIRMNQSDRQII